MATYGDIEVVPNPHAPDVFTDEVMSFHLVEGVLRMVLGAVKNSEGVAPSELQFVVQGRVLMSVPTAQRLAVGLFDFLKQNGADPAAVVPGNDQKPN